MRIPVAADGGALLWSLGEAVLAVGLIKDYIQSMTRKAPMRYSAQVKPISFLKAHAAEVLQRLAEDREALVITQNGEAKAVLQDVASYEETQETLALLKLLALGQREVEEGRIRPAAAVLKGLRARKASA